MLKKRRRKKDEFVIPLIILIILFTLMIFSLSINKNYSKIEIIFHDIGTSIQSIFIPKTKEYNQNLINGINQELEEENKKLKNMLDLNYEKYTFIHANVIKRDIEWYQEITIDKGKKDGIDLDMAVISNQGLIGRISKTGYSSSVIKLITSNSNDMKIAVDINNKTGGVHGIIDAYLEEESLIQVNNISKNSEIELDDKVYTNGLGGVYPSGIYIGKVVEITSDSLGLNKIVKVKSDFSYDKLSYVSIVVRR